MKQKTYVIREVVIYRIGAASPEAAIEALVAADDPFVYAEYVEEREVIGEEEEGA